MAEESIEIVRAALAGFDSGDREAIWAHTAPDFVFDLSRALGPYRGIYGYAEARPLVDEFWDAWDEFRFDVSEFIDAGEHVVTPFMNPLRGRGGIEVESRGTFVWTVRDGAIRRLCLYQERSEALAAVGLSE
jgi:ketosteroid isomerase-like protein